MSAKKTFIRTWLSFVISLILIGAGAVMAIKYPDLWMMSGGLSVFGLIAILAVLWNLGSLLTLVTIIRLRQQGRPESEGIMIGRLYRLGSFISMILAVAYAFGRIGTFGALFSMFGGMLLGWSLQAPVSGFAAWLLVSIKRPFRPGDRIQFPNLGLTGDVKDIGPMYVVLDQVGGTVGSEEAVGRHILMPNAMLFSQVVINFAVCQEAAYMLDEVVVRITYDSNMRKAEQILLDAARKVTGDVIQATGIEPYIRSDLYDYGIYLRLRYQTKVKDRARLAYEINMEIVQEIQHTTSVDLAIPFIYSYRSGMADMDRKEHDAAQHMHQVEIVKILEDGVSGDPKDIEQLSRSIAVSGLLQPVVLEAMPGADKYKLIAGHLRFAACRSLGWKTIPSIIRNVDSGAAMGHPLEADVKKQITSISR